MNNQSYIWFILHFTNISIKTNMNPKILTLNFQTGSTSLFIPEIMIKNQMAYRCLEPKK